MKYVVEKDFLDRFDNQRHCRPGDPHKPPNKERAQQLLELGFISEVKEQHAKKKEAVNPDGDADGKASTSE
ncbi:hypothetical protein P4H66_23445 [Paenibacillus dokdonensis]|uniref:Uncharacterized protein n=1 Tax=Paenibacillus dokdonensis TaxID=2567944 RepID=A0ABU6GVN3_9BACL|nr:hypothetical protein [Paenibacillus dokdonensis]MEC0242770.1 hypothetical protein [Paenibacillus dokdonensis]